jgi:two-component system, OmpR family, response regulator RegX3
MFCAPASIIGFAPWHIAVCRNRSRYSRTGGNPLRIALLEDDDDQAQLLKLWLTEADHVCNTFASSRLFLKEIARESYDLFLLDWEIPDLSGFEVLTWVRENVEARVPVMFVTARVEERDIVAALDAGADDYLIKPLRKLELTARLAALERRARRDTSDGDILDFPPYRIDTRAHAIRRDGLAIELTQKEYDLTVFLFRHIGQLVSRGHVLETIWGLSREINTRTVDTHVSRIRAKLGLADGSPWRLNSVYLYGYRLEFAAPP